MSFLEKDSLDGRASNPLRTQHRVKAQEHKLRRMKACVLFLVCLTAFGAAVRAFSTELGGMNTVNVVAASTPLFSDGFENGLTPWTGQSETVSVQSSIVHHGAQALYASGSSDSYVYKSLSSLSSVNVRVWVRTATLPSLNYYGHDVIQIYSGTTLLASVQIYKESSVGWRVLYWDGKVKYPGKVGSVSSNTWYCVEVSVQVGSPGSVALWVGGSQLATYSASNNGLSITSVRVGAMVGYPSYNKATYSDCVVIDNKYIGTSCEPAPPQKKGTLRVESTPVSGSCYVNGSLWGITPQSKEVNIGHYTVSWGDVSGYATPSPQTAIVEESKTTTVTGIYVEIPPPQLRASISPTSANIQVGSSVTFTLTASGGAPPYTYQWFLNSTLVSNAVGTSYTFVAASPGKSTIFANVYDSSGSSVSTNKATITVVSSSPNPRYGVCFHALEEYNASSKAVLSDLMGAGSFWVRSDWVNPPNPFGPVDMVAWKNDMLQMGLKPLAILDYMTMRERSFTLTDWQNEVTIAVNSAPDIPAWEIWNEPNLRMFQGGYQDGTPTHYMEMLKTAYSIIKAKNPNALVVGPGLYTYAGVAWLQSIINLGALNYLDVVSIHLYMNTVSQNQAILNQARSMVGAKPVWVTEIGTEGPTGYESYQNSYLRKNLSGLTADAIFWYELIDDPRPGEGSFGLARANYTYKLAYYTFKSLLGG